MATSTIAGIVPDTYLGLYPTFLGMLSGYDHFPSTFLSVSEVFYSKFTHAYLLQLARLHGISMPV